MSLEDQLTTVLIELLVAAETNYRQSLAKKREWIVERKAAAAKELQDRKDKAEREAKLLAEKRDRERIAGVLAQAQAFDQANQIRKYVSAVLSQATELPLAADELERWAMWARLQANNLDPVMNGSLLRSIEKDAG